MKDDKTTSGTLYPITIPISEAELKTLANSYWNSSVGPFLYNLTGYTDAKDPALVSIREALAKKALSPATVINADGDIFAIEMLILSQPTDTKFIERCLTKYNDMIRKVNNRTLLHSPTNLAYIPIASNMEPQLMINGGKPTIYIRGADRDRDFCKSVLVVNETAIYENALTTISESLNLFATVVNSELLRFHRLARRASKARFQTSRASDSKVTAPKTKKETSDAS